MANVGRGGQFVVARTTCEVDWTVDIIRFEAVLPAFGSYQENDRNNRTD
jgi:hypothetical protein